MDLLTTIVAVEIFVIISTLFPQTLKNKIGNNEKKNDKSSSKDGKIILWKEEQWWE